MSNSNLSATSGTKFLTFENTDLNIIDLNGSVWLTAGDLSRALGYKDIKSISNLYNRNKDEFRDDETALIDLKASEINGVTSLMTSGNLESKTRIYSTRGCWTIAFLARTDRARAFRTWVKDVLENLNQPKPVPNMTLSQAAYVRENFRKSVFEKASELLVSTDLSESQRIINAQIEKRVDERMELLTADRHSGVRILTESNENGDYSSVRLLPSEHLISNNEIADHILSVKGPRMRDLNRIMQACMTRMSEVYELPLGFFDECGDDL